MHLATDRGEADAQPRSKDLGTQLRFSISAKGVEGQRNTVGGHSSSGFVMLLCLLSREGPETGNLLCQGRDILGINKVISERE